MSETLEYSVQFEGAEEAARAIEDLKVKQAQFADEAKRLAKEISDEQKKASKSSGDAAEVHAQVIDALRRQMVQAQSASKSYADQTKQLEAAQKQAATATQQAQQGYSSLGSALGMAGQAVGHFNQSAGQMVSALGQTVSQIPQLTAQFGPLGLAIAGANLAMSAWATYEEAERRAITERRTQTARLNETFEHLRTSIAATREEHERWAGAIAGGGTREDNLAAIERLQGIRRTLLQAEQSRRGGLSIGSDQRVNTLAALQDLGTGIPELGLTGGTLSENSGAGSQARQAALAQVVGLIRQAVATGRRSAATGPTFEQEQAGNAFLAGMGTSGNITTDPYSSTAPTTHRSGARGEDPFSPQAMQAALRAAIDRQKASQRAISDARNATQLELADRERAQDAAIDAQKLEVERQQYDARRALEARDRAASEQRFNNELTIYDAQRSGLQAVLEAAQQVNRQLLGMHQQTLDSGFMWARGMAGIGNDVANSLGSNLTNAFSSSLDAWLSGSKSFGDAALDMAKNVTKALTMQGIVKVITETAEGLGALALTWGVPNPAALLHFASAATWGAIAGVAGGIGAGIGAFGGGGASAAQAGGGGGGGQSRAAMQPANQQGGGTTVININVPNALMTNYERAQFVGNSFQQARRMGMRVAA